MTCSRNCPPLAASSRACHCAACHVTFATLTDFDSHQIRRFGTTVPLACRKPETLGLQPRNGVWGTPAGNAARDARCETLRRTQAARNGKPGH